jgi:hypothetical protein
MATATKKRPTKKAGTTKSAAAKATAKKNDGPGKRELAKARDAELTTTIVARRDDGDKWGEIASDLNITPGKAQFLMMQHEVAHSPKLRLKHTDEASLVAAIRSAREANDAHSSWGWIAARTGVSEGKIKSVAEEAGIPVSGSNIAVARAESNGGGTKGDGKTRRQATTKGTTTKKSSASKAAKAKARARARKGTTDPS